VCKKRGRGYQGEIEGRERGDLKRADGAISCVGKAGCGERASRAVSAVSVKRRVRERSGRRHIEGDRWTGMQKADILAGRHGKVIRHRANRSRPDLRDCEEVITCQGEMKSLPTGGVHPARFPMFKSGRVHEESVCGDVGRENGEASGGDPG